MEKQSRQGDVEASRPTLRRQRTHLHQQKGRRRNKSRDRQGRAASEVKTKAGSKFQVDESLLDEGEPTGGLPSLHLSRNEASGPDRISQWLEVNEHERTCRLGSASLQVHVTQQRKAIGEQNPSDRDGSLPDDGFSNGTEVASKEESEGRRRNSLLDEQCSVHAEATLDREAGRFTLTSGWRSGLLQSTYSGRDGNANVNESEKESCRGLVPKTPQLSSSCSLREAARCQMILPPRRVGCGRREENERRNDINDIDTGDDSFSHVENRHFDSGCQELKRGARWAQVGVKGGGILGWEWMKLTSPSLLARRAWQIPTFFVRSEAPLKNP